MEELETYASRRKNTVYQYILTRTILDLFLQVEIQTGEWLAQRWW